MKILHINTERTWRGGEQQTLYLASGLHEQGVATVMICQPASPMEERARAAGVPVFPVKMRGEWDLRAMLTIRRIMRRERFDIVHMHTSHAHTLGVGAARLGGGPMTVVSRRVDFSIYRHALSVSGLKYKFGVDRYIAISHAIRDVLINDGIPAKKISVVHSGIDLSRFEGIEGRAKLRAEFGLGDDVPVVGTVAHFAWHKGLEYLVDAAVMLSEAVPGVKIFLIGEGDLEPQVRARAAERNVEDTVVFAGFRKDIPEVLDFLDVFVMPSVMEGLCTSILDALASRKPVVGSEVGGIPEIIEDGVTGLLAPPRDAQALSDALARMLKNRQQAQTLADQGCRKVEDHFSVQSMVRGVQEVYENMLKTI